MTSKPDICLINAKAFHILCRQKGVAAFSARISDDRKETPAMTTEPDKAEALKPLAGPYDLKITLEEGARPSYGVGGITVQYPARLYSIATVPTDIPHSLL